LFDIFLSLDAFPISSYPYISLLIHTYISHSIVVLFRLSTFQHQGIVWDRDKIRADLNLGDILKLWIQRWQMAPAACRIVRVERENDIWDYFMGKLPILADWWQEKFESVDGDARADDDVYSSHGVDTTLTGSYGQRQADTMDYTALSMAFSDDLFMGDFMRGLESTWDPRT
jgi:hypothetical protein